MANDYASLISNLLALIASARHPFTSLVIQSFDGLAFKLVLFIVKIVNQQPFRAADNVHEELAGT